MKISGNKILITGGGSGIGYGLAKRFISENNTVIICGRRQAVLDEAKQQLPELITYQCDLAIESERIKLFEWIKVNHSDLNVLINNAGIQHWETLEDDDFIDKVKEEITINIEAPLHLTALFSKLPSLNTIMNVTSGLAFAPLIKVPVYSATKAFFHSFTLSSRELLKSRNIDVIEIIPPALNTDLGGKGKHDYAPPVADFIESIFHQLKQGKKELSYGFSESMLKSNENLHLAFKKLNQLD
jgi:uncharacterized oxidoreductase